MTPTIKAASVKAANHKTETINPTLRRSTSSLKGFIPQEVLV
jgi:hypothetical protein